MTAKNPKPKLEWKTEVHISPMGSQIVSKAPLGNGQSAITEQYINQSSEQILKQMIDDMVPFLYTKSTDLEAVSKLPPQQGSKITMIGTKKNPSNDLYEQYIRDFAEKKMSFLKERQYQVQFNPIKTCVEDEAK